MLFLKASKLILKCSQDWKFLFGPPFPSSPFPKTRIWLYHSLKLKLHEDKCLYSTDGSCLECTWYRAAIQNTSFACLLQHIGSLFQHACSRLWQDLVPLPGIEPGPPALGVQNLNHWIIREVPVHRCLNDWMRRLLVSADRTRGQPCKLSGL